MQKFSVEWEVHYYDPDIKLYTTDEMEADDLFDRNSDAPTEAEII